MTQEKLTQSTKMARNTMPIVPSALMIFAFDRPSSDAMAFLPKGVERLSRLGDRVQNLRNHFEPGVALEDPQEGQRAEPGVRDRERDEIAGAQENRREDPARRRADQGQRDVGQVGRAEEEAARDRQ